MESFELSVIAILGLTVVLSALTAWRGKWVRAIIFFVAVGSTTLASWAVFLPVRPAPSPNTKPTNIVYLGVTDPVYLASMKLVIDTDPDADWLFVGPSGSRAVVKRLLPGAKFEEPLVDSSTHGVTLAVALSDFQDRIPRIESGGSVYFFAPREKDLQSAITTSADLVAKHPWLANRMFTLFPGEGLLAAMPAPPTITPDAPLEVPQDAKTFDLDILVAQPAGFGGQLRAKYRRGFQESDASGIADDGSGMLKPGTNDTTPILQPTYNRRVQLDAPANGTVNIIECGIYTQFNECMSYGQIYVQRMTPQIGILVSKSGYDGKLLDLMSGTSLQYKKVILDLSGGVAPEVNARALEPWGALLLDQTLSADQGAHLAEALAATQRAYGQAPKIIMIGMARNDRPPPGWAPFMASMPIQAQRGQRVIAFTCDFSGSMGRVDSKFGISRIRIARDCLYALADGLVQRNSNDLLLVLDQNGNTLNYKDAADLSQKFGAIGTDYDYWEGGRHLLRIAELLKDGHPISDVLIFWDATDILGFSQSGRGSNDLDQAQIDAANYLASKGVRLHIVSIGGDLTGENIPQFVKDAVKVRFSSMPDLASLQSAIKNDIFRKLLPRLQVKVEEEGLAKAPSSENAQMLRDAASKALLINSIGKYADVGQHGDKTRILLYAKHFNDGDNRVSPLFVQGEMKSGDITLPTYWLSIDLVAEHAKIDDQDDANQDALLDLMVAAIGATTTRFQKPPVYWRVDASGMLRARSRTRMPFNIKTNSSGEPIITSSVGGRSQSPSLDFRRLAWPGFRFEGLDEVAVVGVSFDDHDPQIGEVRMSMPLAPIPPRLIADPLDRSMIAPPAQDPGAATHRHTESNTEERSFALRVPQWLMAPIVVLAGLLIGWLPRQL